MKSKVRRRLVSLRDRLEYPLHLDSEEAAELYVDEVLDGQGRFQYLDSVGSVSGLVEVEGPCMMWPCQEAMDRQYRRFLNGS